MIAPGNIKHTLCQNKADLNQESRSRQKAGQSKPQCRKQPLPLRQARRKKERKKERKNE
jgi:hypothetical protein